MWENSGLSGSKVVDACDCYKNSNVHEGCALMLSNLDKYREKNPGGRPRIISTAMGRKLLQTVKATKGLSNTIIPG